MRHILLVICILASGLSYSQENIEFSKELFPGLKDEFKEAVKNLEAGDGYFEKEQFVAALNNYLKANNFNPDNARLNYRIGYCYMKSDLKYKALDFFLKAEKINPTVVSDLKYLIARGYHLIAEYDNAIQYYSAYKKKLEAMNTSAFEIVDKRLEECKNALALIEKPGRVFVDNLGKTINTSYNEHSPLISADESWMIFTSTRSGSIGNLADPFDNQYDEDVYSSVNENGKWDVPLNLGKPVNTVENDATVGLSPDGYELLIYNGKKGNGDIQVCYLEGDTWTTPKSLPKPINSEFCESSASFSSDGNILYFVSDRPGGMGGKDIWRCFRSEKNDWVDLENLSSQVNTPYDEESIFLHPDGQRLYFSSKGHNTIGGYDIFLTTVNEKGKWSKPENLGFPINSPDDDLCFVLTANGRRAYFSSPRQEGMGRFDLYSAFFLGPEKPMMLGGEEKLLAGVVSPISESVSEPAVEIKTIRLTIVKGYVKDAITGNPVIAEIEIFDNEKNEIVIIEQTNSKTGRFLVSLPSGKNYGMAVKANEYLFHSENFNIPVTTGYQEITKEIGLNSAKKDVKIVLKNVFFEPNSSNLNPSSYAELGRLTKLLTDMPGLSIEISGHTDNVGAAAYNQKLSESRAKSVVDFLTKEGVPSSRLQYKGYGMMQAVATNDNEEGRSQNRRVEFKILENN